MKLKNTVITGQGRTHPKESYGDISEVIPFTLGIIGGKEIPTINARNLHAFLGNKELFATWIKKRIAQYGFIKGNDYETFLESTKKGRPREEYLISSDMAKELSMVERNDQGKRARQYFIDCEERLYRVAPQELVAARANWRKKRVTACEEHKVMADAMKSYIQRTGDTQRGHAYSNECTFLARLVLGMHPPVWAKKNGITGKIRDHMSTHQLALLAYLESRDCALLDMDMRTAERKERLTTLAARWLDERLGADHA
ncbi:antA/AntB antirepressor family protein [Serratia fonticola]|uniref:antA/AntB antirepressor family protein n=1 Tax=Serratia fonticola TaxID=47917 RepID=UPI00217A1E88|nr:antA/AntB antirepressor family protein [Serratia fonticola]CAI0831803.1 Phage anti-repressor protein [Serratia fonticola]CAI0958500.1 Phage anti-repressor protein [Serratia fonticola]